MRIVVLNPSDFRHWTLYVKGCGPWTDTTTPRTNAPVRFRYVPCPALGILGRIPFDTATR